MSSAARKTIAHNFDRVAEGYDRAASVQAQVAVRLVQKALRRLPTAPLNIIDIGCGTGFAASAASRFWPFAHMSAMDAAPAMLEEIRRKLPRVETIESNIASVEMKPAYDLILSSMALHWFTDARSVLTRWQQGLNPHGRLFAALLIDGSFYEWDNLCEAEGAASGLWPFPHAGFAQGIASEMEVEEIRIEYPSARDFLRRLKATGAAAPHPSHRPINPAAMRRILEFSPRPFTATYRVLYIEAPSPISI